MASPVDELLADVRSAGTEALRGGFTLDRDKAREKMSAFSLADPRTYVLELVQAAVLKQGEAIRGQVKPGGDPPRLRADIDGPVRLDIDSDDVHLRFGGAPFTVEDFERLYGSLFSGATDWTSRARRQLAVGLNAALALNPRYIRVVSGDEEGSATLELRPGKPDAYQASEESAGGTHIHVKSRFRPGLVLQFYRNVAGTIAEEVHVLERCARSWYPITLDGKPASHGLGSGLEGALEPEVLDDGGVLGVVGFYAGVRETAVLRLYVNGVYVTTHRPDTLPRGLWAEVDGVGLRKDVSQANVVEDAAYAGLLSRVAEAADRSLARLGQRLVAELEGGDTDPHRMWIWQRLREGLRRRVQLDGLQSAERGRLEHVLWRIPFWQSIDGRWWSLAHMTEACAGAEVGWTEKTYADSLEELDRLFLSEAPIVLHLPEEEDVALLARLFGERLTQQTEALDRLLLREQNRRLWRSRQCAPELDGLGEGHRYLATKRVERGEVRGQVGLPVQPSLHLALSCVLDGHLLCRRGVDGSLRNVVGGVVAVLEADYTPGELYDDVQSDAALGRALEALLVGLRGAFDRCAAGWFQARRRDEGSGLPEAGALRKRFLHGEEEVRQRVLDYLGMVFGEGFPATFYAAFGVSPSAAASTAELTELRPELAATDEAADPQAPPYDRLPLFGTVSGDWLSLAALRHWSSQDGELRWVGDGAELDPECGARILRLPGVAVRVLEAVFGSDRLRADPAGYRMARKEAQHLRKAPEPVALPRHQHHLFRVGFAAGNVVGELALMHRIIEPMGSWELRLLRKERLLTTHRQRLSLPTGLAVVNSDALVPTEGWDDVVEGPALGGVRAVLRRAAQQLLALLATRFGQLDVAAKPEARDLIRTALRAWVPPVLGPVFVQLRRRAADFDQAVACYEALLAPLDAVGLDALEPLLLQAVEASEGLPDPGETLAALDAALWPLQAASAELHLDLSQVAGALQVPAHLSTAEGGGCTEGERVLPALLAAPVFEATDDSFVSVHDLRARIRSGQTLYYVYRYASEVEQTDAWLLRVSGPELDLLRCLLGKAHLQHGGGMLREASLKQRFLAREVVTELTLPADEVVTTLSLDAEGLRGEVGLLIDPAADSCIYLHHQQRFVSRESNFTRPGLLAAVDDDRLTLLRDYSAVARDERLQQVYRLCEAQRDPLLLQVVGSWDTLSAERRALLVPALLDLFAARAGEGWSGGAELADPALVPLAEAEVLPGVGGAEHSLEALRAQVARTGQVDYLSTPRLGEPWDPEHIVLVSGRTTNPQLKRIFGTVRDYAARWDDEQVLVALRQHEAPALPPPEPPAALVSTSFRVSPWNGTLAVPADPQTPLGIRLGVYGLEAICWQPSAVFPCWGRFDTDKVRVYRRQQRGTLTEAQERILERQACSLYQTLASRFRSGALAGPDEETARIYLRHALQRIHRRIQQDGDADLNRYWRSLYRRLEDQPLFPAADGELLSLRAALELRPPELAAWGLWSEPEAECDAPTEVTLLPTRVVQCVVEDAPAAPADAAEPLAAVEAPPVEEVEAEPLPEPDPPEALSAPAPDDDLDPVAEVAPQDLEAVEMLTAEERLEASLRVELDALHTPDNGLLGDVALVAFRYSKKPTDRAASCDDRGVRLYRKHPVVAALLEAPEPAPTLLWMLTLGVYTAVNLHLEEVTDDHEAAFQHLLVERVRTGAFRDASPEG